MSTVGIDHPATSELKVKQAEVHNDAPASDKEAQPSQVDIDAGFDPAAVAATMRKVDWRLIPILSAMYCISLIDRTNLSIARAANKIKMDKDLGTSQGQRYSIIVLMFFIPVCAVWGICQLILQYIILEIPSQIGLRKCGVRLWLGGAVVAWGIVVIGMGFVKTWQQLAGLRVLLGAFEATLFPGSSYLLSCWYPRHSMARRNVLFYIVAVVLGNFSSILGYAFSLMDGTRDLSGWQWLFIWFGVMTVVIGVIALLTLVDFPDKATFLTEEQKNIVMTRIQRDRGDAEPDALTWSKIVKYSKDFKPWLFGFFFMASTMSSYALVYFLPVILNSLGFDNVESMVLNIPPNAWSAIPALATAYIADKFRHMRAHVVIFSAVCVVVGTAMYSQLPKGQKVARYVGIFIAVQGGNCNVPLVLSWAQTSIRTQSKRAFMSAVVVAMGGLGGIVASVAFNQKQAAKGYPTGVYLTIALNAATAVGAGLLHIYFRLQNKQAETSGKVLEGDEGFRYQG